MKKIAAGRIFQRGQAMTEYILLVSLVLTIFAGTTALFSKQIQAYLNLLFDFICLPL